MPERYKIACPNCGGTETNHTVIHEKNVGWATDDEDIRGTYVYSIIRCDGCETYRFRSSEFCSEAIGDRGYEEYGIRVYPEQKPNSRQGIDQSKFPNDVAKMYSETLSAFNAGILTLCGGGLRATVEAICIDRGISNGKLYEKINKLVTKGFMVQSQADLLHEERYIGNYALHEMRTPSKQDLDDGLRIIENLLETIYIIPHRAERLKLRREKDGTET